MATIELELKGNSLPRGKVWVNCKDSDSVCFEDLKQSLPPPPKLNPGERAVFVMEFGKAPGWETQKPPSDVVASGGISLMTILACYLAYKKWRKRQEIRKTHYLSSPAK